jgi:hypothetical protein
VSPGLTRVTGGVTTLNGSPIAGSRLVVRTSIGQTVGYGVSDGLGNFSIDAVPAGEVTLYGDRNGFSAAQGTLVIPPNTYTINSNIVLGGNGPTFVERNPLSPFVFKLDQSYPNPFNPSTKIGFRIQVSGFTTLKVFDVLGREVATLVSEELKAGSYQATFSADGLASGMYFYHLQAGNYSETKKMLLLK